MKWKVHNAENVTLTKLHNAGWYSFSKKREVANDLDLEVNKSYCVWSISMSSYLLVMNAGGLSSIYDNLKVKVKNVEKRCKTSWLISLHKNSDVQRFYFLANWFINWFGDHFENCRVERK